jgi:succinoglycan biosynthesis protein ExoA
MGVITILTSLLALHVSVVVACRNESSSIRELLDSLVRLERTNLVLDAVIADGMSTDGTRRLLDEFTRIYPWCTVIDNPGQIVSTGLNRAILLATGEFIVRMDAHTVYEPNYVVRCISVLRTSGANNVGGPQRSRARGYWPRAIHAGFHSPFATGGARFRDDKYSGPVDTVPYGCWRRDFLIAIGLFDETLVRNQDDELNVRIRLAGGIIWQDPSIVSRYSPRSTLSGLFRQYFQYGFWRVAVLRKHSGKGSLRHFVPGAAALLGLGPVLLIALGMERAAAAAVLIVLGFLYLVLSLNAALRSAGREGWDLLPALPITFTVYQSAYAAGFCVGLVYWGLRSGRNRKNPRGISGARPDNSA